MKILTSLEKQNRTYLVAASYGLVLLIGLFDYWTGHELAFSVFYVLPIFLITWVTDTTSGFVASLICAITWFIADAAAANTYTSPFIPLWNTLIRLTFFVIITLLLSSLKTSLRLAHTDTLTSAANSRYFQEIAQMEIDRFQRYQHPFSMAYLDLDNFKSMNDQFGHLAGDEVLCILVDLIRKVIRKTDFVARVGGDEFVVLFLETDEDAAQVICTKLQSSFLVEMEKRAWPVTFSLGVVTCRSVPTSVDDLIRMADHLMYTAKAHGKNEIFYSTYAG